MHEEFQTVGPYLVHLIRCALHSLPAEEKPTDCTWEQVYRLAKQNSVDGISFYGLNGLQEPPDGELQVSWKKQADVDMFRYLTFSEERRRILEEMDAAGLSYLPLKGIRLASYYPQPGMRSMGDNDILYGFVEPCPAGGYQIRGENAAARKETVRQAQACVREIMERCGFQADSFLGAHDVYRKASFLEFEMHRSLMSRVNPFYDYYENPWSRAVQDRENPHAFAFSPENEYVYLLAHAFKHFDGSGCGIRCAVDLYVFLKKEGAGLDWDFIRRELETLRLTEFEAQLRQMACHAFAPEESLIPADLQLLYHLLGCGTYGTDEICMAQRVEKLQKAEHVDLKQAKRRYFSERCFPSEARCKEFYPFFYRHKHLRFLLPFCRLTRGLVVHPGKLWQEWNNLRKLH